MRRICSGVRTPGVGLVGGGGQVVGAATTVVVGLDAVVGVVSARFEARAPTVKAIRAPEGVPFPAVPAATRVGARST